MITDTTITLTKGEAEHKLADFFAKDTAMPLNSSITVTINDGPAKRYPSGVERIRAIKYLREIGAFKLRPIAVGDNGYVGLGDAKDVVDKIIAIFEGKGI